MEKTTSLPALSSVKEQKEKLKGEKANRKLFGITPSKLSELLIINLVVVLKTTLVDEIKGFLTAL